MKSFKLTRDELDLILEIYSTKECQITVKSEKVKKRIV